MSLAVRFVKGKGHRPQAVFVPLATGGRHARPPIVGAIHFKDTKKGVKPSVSRPESYGRRKETMTDLMVEDGSYGTTR